MICEYDPRFVPAHQAMINCPKCHMPVLAGEFHLDHDNPLTAQFVAFMATRPRIRFLTEHEKSDIAALQEWVDLKADYISAMASGHKILRRRNKRAKGDDDEL